MSLVDKACSMASRFSFIVGEAMQLSQAKTKV
jgi:hypothetical protein